MKPSYPIYAFVFLSFLRLSCAFPFVPVYLRSLPRVNAFLRPVCIAPASSESGFRRISSGFSLIHSDPSLVIPLFPSHLRDLKCCMELQQEPRVFGQRCSLPFQTNYPAWMPGHSQSGYCSLRLFSVPGNTQAREREVRRRLTSDTPVA